MKPVVVDAGPSLNFLAVNEINLMHSVLAAEHHRVLFPREVANEIEDKSTDKGKFTGTARVFNALIREKKFEILESDIDNDADLVQAMRSQVGKPLTMPPPGRVFERRTKDLGETMAVAHAIKLRNLGHDVTLVIDDGGARTMAKLNGFERIYTTIRVLALAGSLNMITYAECKKIYERLRPSDGSEPMDNGLPHWSKSGLDDRRLYAATADPDAASRRVA